MKKILGTFVFLGVWLAGSALHASSVAFIYLNEAGIISGKPILGTIVQGGVAVEASRVWPGTGKWFVGFANGDLRHATLLRMDSDLDVAVLKIQDPVTEQNLTDAFNKRLQPYLTMLAINLSTKSVSSDIALAMPPPPGDPFGFRINGVPVGTEPVNLVAKRKKCSIKLEVVSQSTTSFWNVEVVLESEPQLSFWKRGEVETLNDIPKHTLNYGFQAYGIPLRTSKSFSIPLDVDYIKEENYQWTLTVKTKGAVFMKKISVHFEGKKR